MDKIILMAPAETFHDDVKALPVPLIAYGLCHDDNPDVLLVYENLEEAA